MRILIISHEYPPFGGGGSNACMYLSRQYAQLGHHTDIITVWYKDLRDEEEINIGQGNIHIIRLRSKRKRKENCSFFEMFDFMIKAVKKADSLVNIKRLDGVTYDVCQIFFGIPSGPVGYYLKRKHRIPYVIRFGGGDIPGFQDRFRIVYKLLSPALKTIWKHADALVANSEGLRKMANSFCNKYPVYIIPNGVDTNEFFPISKSVYNNNKINILFVSRLIERKGLQYVIPSLNKIENDSGKIVHLTVVGDGPYRKQLEALTDKNNVSNKVTFVGNKNHVELIEYYQFADLFILPSRKEGMPNVVLEAMACGLPIVISPCQGSVELINENGIIADNNLDLFFESILKVINLPVSERMKMGRISRKRAVEYFSWKEIAKKYVYLYEFTQYY